MNNNVRKMAVSGIVAAMYAALTMALAPISYGPIQFRVSEVLCILPFFLPYTAVGLFVGCMAANLLSTMGVFDIVFGSLATLGAALCTAHFGKTKVPGLWPRRILACLMPVLWNAVIIGAMIAILDPATENFLRDFTVFGLEVGAGELGVMFLLGLPLMYYLPKLPAFQALIEKYKF